MVLFHLHGLVVSPSLTRSHSALWIRAERWAGHRILICMLESLDQASSITRRDQLCSNTKNNGCWLSAKSSRESDSNDMKGSESLICVSVREETETWLAASRGHTACIHPTMGHREFLEERHLFRSMPASLTLVSKHIGSKDRLMTNPEYLTKKQDPR